MVKRKKTLQTKAIESQESVALPDWATHIGLDETLRVLRRMVKNGALASVLLFEGREGLGKRALMAALAAMHYCDSHDACGVCAACRRVMSGRHPDVLWLEAEPGGRLLIEHAVLLQEHLSLSGENGRSPRLAIVVDADRLSTQAANRLLKTLEEPPMQARIFLSTGRGASLLDTVLSRCVKVHVPPPSREALQALVERDRDALGLAPLDALAMDELLRRSGLAPGRALVQSREAASEGMRSLFSHLIEVESASAALSAAEELGRARQLSAGAVLELWEIELNRHYRQSFGQKRGAKTASPAVVASRRDILREAKRLAIFAHVALNVQLISESLALDSLR